MWIGHLQIYFGFIRIEFTLYFSTEDMIYGFCSLWGNEGPSVLCKMCATTACDFHSGQSANHCAGLLPVPEVSNFSGPKILVLTELVSLFFTLRASVPVQYSVQFYFTVNARICSSFSKGLALSVQLLWLLVFTCEKFTNLYWYNLLL